MTERCNGGVNWKGAARWLLTTPCLLFLLSACDAGQWPLASEQSKPVTRHPSMAPPASKAAVASTTKPAPTQSQTKSTGAVPTAKSSAPETVTPVVASTTTVPSALDGEGNPVLVGLDSEQTKVMLGPPTEEEMRSPAKIWRYRTPQCTLDVALYPDVQTHVFRVLNYEVNGNDGTEQGRRQCIAGLRSGLRTR